MAAPARLQRAAARRNPPPPHRRVHVASPSTNASGGNSGQQGQQQAPVRLQSHHSPGNQVLPLTGQPSRSEKEKSKMMETLPPPPALMNLVGADDV